MAVNKKNLKLATFSPGQEKGIYKDPHVSKTRGPSTKDKDEIGSMWIDSGNDNAYVLTSIVANSANWELFTDEVPTTGTDGQLWIGATGAAAAWNNLTSTGLSVTITNTANGINLEAAGVAALTSLDSDVGTATPNAGVIDITGGTNIGTTGALGILTVNLDASPSVAGSLTAGVDFTMTSGTCTITSSDSAGDDIYLHADGGVGETINIHADQGTAVDSVTIQSDVGGVLISSGLATADAINIDATNAAGGIDIDAGTAGISIVTVNGPIALISGTGAITVGTDAAAHAVTVGSTNTTASTTIQSGSGDVTVTSTDAVTVDAAGVLELNSSAGVIGIGNDAVAQAINIGTGAAARTITIGNGTAASAVDINCGTGDVTVGTNATAHTVTVGSTNTTSNVIVQSGTGGIQETSGGAYAVDAVGAVTIESSGSTIGIGVDVVAQDINIGTGAAARTVTVGNGTGATSIVVDCGTGACDFGANATAHTTTVGSVTAAADTNLYAGTGALTIDGLGIIDIDAAGALSINSDGGAINIGNDADAQAVNVGTGGAARPVTLGSTNTTSATTLQSGTGGVSIEAAGIVDMVPATATFAGAAVTIDANVGVGTFTGLTTASAAAQIFTITNSVVGAGSAIFVSASNLGANDAQMTVTRVTPGAGSFTVTLTNNGAAALNGNVLITFWIIA